MPVFKFWHGKTLKININKLIWKILKKKIKNIDILYHDMRKKYLWTCTCMSWRKLILHTLYMKHVLDYSTSATYNLQLDT